MVFSRTGDSYTILSYKFQAVDDTIVSQSEIDYGGSDDNTKAVALNYDKAYNRLVIHTRDRKVLLVNLQHLNQQTVDYPVVNNNINQLKSQDDSGHISMSSAPFTFNLFEESLVSPHQKIRHWIWRLKLDPNLPEFIPFD